MLATLRAKYESAMRTKMLIKLERDRIASRALLLHSELSHLRGGQMNGGQIAAGQIEGGQIAAGQIGGGQIEGGHIEGGQIEGGQFSIHQIKKSPRRPKRPSKLPEDARENPYLEMSLEPPNVEQWALSKTFESHSLSGELAHTPLPTPRDHLP